MPCKTCGKDGHNTSTCVEKKQTTPLAVDTCVKEKLLILRDVCREVASTLKKGRVECVYQNAVCQELQERGISYIAEETIPIYYKGKYVGIERIDVCLTNFLDFIYEFKATGSELKPENIWQLVSYLNHKKYSYGCLVNFNQSVKGCLEILFLVLRDSVWYIWNAEKEEGEALVEYGF